MKITTDKNGHKTLTLITSDSIFRQGDWLSNGHFLIKLSMWESLSRKIKMPPECQVLLTNGKDFSYRDKKLVRATPQISKTAEQVTGLPCETVTDTRFRYCWAGPHNPITAILKPECSEEPICISTAYLGLFPDCEKIYTTKGKTDSPVYACADGAPWILVMPLLVKGYPEYEKFCQLIN